MFPFIGRAPSYINDPSLVLWLSSDMLYGMNSTLPANSTAVSFMSDLSGNNVHMTQTTGANQPLFKTNIANGYPALLLDGSATYLANTNTTSNIINGVTGGSIFAVSKSIASTVANQRILLIAEGTGFGGSARMSHYIAGSGSGNVFTTNIRTTDGIAAVFSSQGTSIQTLRCSGSVFNCTATTLNTYADGTTGASSTIASGSTTSTPSASIELGGVFGTSEIFNGYIFEILVYNKALSGIQLTNVQNYLRNKYGTP